MVLHVVAMVFHNKCDQIMTLGFTLATWYDISMISKETLLQI